MMKFDGSRHIGWIVWVMATIALLLVAFFIRYAAGVFNDFSMRLRPTAHGVLIKDGQQLLDVCLKDREFCKGYISGTIRAEKMVMKDTKLCSFKIPDDETEDQLVDIVVKYLQAHSEMHLPDGAVITAIADAFPCPK
jgi:hypothetical protein